MGMQGNGVVASEESAEELGVLAEQHEVPSLNKCWIGCILPPQLGGLVVCCSVAVIVGRSPGIVKIMIWYCVGFGLTSYEKVDFGQNKRYTHEKIKGNLDRKVRKEGADIKLFI